MLADSEVRMKSIERDVLQLRESNRELEISSQRNDDTLKVAFFLEVYNYSCTNGIVAYLCRLRLQRLIGFNWN